uniref:Uncharacterized protein n=1 Tax=Steinernema glaseri TaxID=37863 RepID=A0A1I7YL73_9BILA
MKGFIFLLFVAGIIALDVPTNFQSFPERVSRPKLQPCVDFSNAVCSNRIAVATKRRLEFEEHLMRAFKDYKPDDVTQELHNTLILQKSSDFNVGLIVRANSIVAI